MFYVVGIEHGDSENEPSVNKDVGMTPKRSKLHEHRLHSRECRIYQFIMSSQNFPSEQGETEDRSAHGGTEK